MVSLLFLAAAASASSSVETMFICIITARFGIASFESVSGVGSVKWDLASALAGDATRSRLVDNIATAATVSAGR